MRLPPFSLLPMALLGAAALPLLLLLPTTAEAKVGKTKLSPDGLETSQMGLGALHFAELDGKDACVGRGGPGWGWVFWVLCVGWHQMGVSRHLLFCGGCCWCSC